jgi:predicted dehydrogenase
MNILILGLGSIGRRHARILRAICPDGRMFALRSGTGWGPEEGVTDIRDPAELPGRTDLAIISSPTNLHPEHVKKVLPLKPFLFLEKPLALTVAEGKTIVDAVEDAKIGSYVGCHLRFHPELLKLRSELKKHPRSIASVRVICRSWLPDWQPGRDYRKSFRADAGRSGGVHLELIHELDYVTWVLGSPKKRTVELHDAFPELQIPVPAEAHYELTYSDFVATIDLSYASHESERRFEIQFTDGTSKILNLLLSPDALQEVYTAQMRHVLSCIAGNELSLHPVREALKTLILALP